MFHHDLVLSPYHTHRELGTDRLMGCETKLVACCKTLTLLLKPDLQEAILLLDSSVGLVGMDFPLKTAVD